MTRQQSAPILIGKDKEPSRSLERLDLSGCGSFLTEADVQALVQAHPECLPAAEIDPLFSPLVPICTELNTPAGPIDNFMVTPTGLPVLVECKLWRNPEARRAVIGQILDYAKELGRWSSSDLQREVSRRLRRSGNPLLDLVREAGHDVDEIDFNDALTRHLRTGRFLLMIVGDGIREGVEAISEYLQRHANLHFTFGLVEMPIFELPDGRRIALPRILARTALIRREVIAVPSGLTVVEEASSPDAQATGDPWVTERLRFFTELLDGLRLSDPEQPAPKPTPKGYLFFYMPAPASSCWINISVRAEEVGLWLVGNKGTFGDKAVGRLAEDWDEIAPLLGGSAELRPWQNDPARRWISEFMAARPFADAKQRGLTIEWLRERIDTWISVLRPRIRAAVADLELEER